jgi:regulator of RNase E activity RraA
MSGSGASTASGTHHVVCRHGRRGDKPAGPRFPEKVIKEFRKQDLTQAQTRPILTDIEERAPMPPLPFAAADLELLRQWDTPTICNALEVVIPSRRGRGFTVRPFVVADPTLPPICGIARTGQIRAAAPSGRSREDDRAARMAWYAYVADAPMPTIAVIEDLDEEPGFGTFFGELNSTIHRGLGCMGCVTSGAFRDLGALAQSFQVLGGMVSPSHAFLHMVDFGREVVVHGMTCGHDEVVHADRHGAVIIPSHVVRLLPTAIELMAQREAVVLETARQPGFSVAALQEAFRRADDIG